MAAPRPYWKGYLKLSLVSCPIALYTASSSAERVSFRQINKKTGNRLRQQLVDDVTREPVDAADKGRGYEVAKNVYLPIDEEELDAVAVESSHTIEIDAFVPREQIDERYLDSPYYIAPNDDVGQEAFAVIREAMRGKGMVALARVVLAKRERVVMLQPWDKGLLGTTLRYPYEVRSPEEYFSDIKDVKVLPDMRKLAEHILESKTEEFEPEKFVDHYEEAVVDLLKHKQAGMPVPKDKPAAPTSNVINLMDALRRSIADEKASNGKAAADKKPLAAKGKKVSSAKQEAMRAAPQFKFPIAGGKGKASDKAAPAAKAAAPVAKGRVAKRKSA
jgi:DNA end-binding protein Ku